MARPQSVLGIRPASTLGIDIILTVDTSGSMKALDLDSDRPIYNRRTRLQVVKDVVAQFIKKRNQDQIGLVVFGVEAFLQCPLTLDHHILTVLLDRMQNGMAGEATAIGSGIGAAVNRLKKSKAKSRVMVLLTDGINNAGPLSPMLAAEIAKTFDVKIYTIGVGTRGEAPFIVEQPFFGKSIVYDEVSIDEDALREVANITGGEYFRAENTKSLENIYKQIDKLEKSQSDTPAIIDYDEHAPVFIGIALAMLIFEILILGTWLRRLP
ncbi:MAG: VWA domain-containing protein [Deltaproteobacteria bacterium]|nr:VWA domain-containing protein [Deltaproteobacteria bacterium]